MNRKFQIITVFLIAIVLLTSIGILIYLIVRQSSRSTNTTSGYSISGPVTLVSSPVSTSSDYNFYQKYLNSDITQASTFPFDNNYFSKYYNIDLNVKSVPLKIVLVDASSFQNTRQMIEKMYLSNDISGNFVSSSSRRLNGHEFEMGIMSVPVGPITYMLFGGYIKDGQGYYFQVFLGRKDQYQLTDNTFDSIYAFNSERNPMEVLNILTKISNENLSGSFFHKFDNSVIESETTKKYIQQRKSVDGFPTTF